MKYHIFLWSTAVFWGVSFVATGLVVEKVPPFTAAAIRFLIAWVVLFLINRKKTGLPGKELFFAGFWGVAMYFLFENAALKFTSPTNTSLIISTIPLINLFYLKIFHKQKIGLFNYIGSIVSFAGVAIIILNGVIVLKLNPLGDLLVFGAAISWIMYTHYFMSIQKFMEKKENVPMISATREITFYGFVSLIPFALFELINTPFDFSVFLFDQSVLTGTLYLGIICSSIGYMFWNKAIQHLGARYVTNAIYALPLITAFAEVIIMNKIPNSYLIAGGGMVVAGLFLAEIKRSLPNVPKTH